MKDVIVIFAEKALQAERYAQVLGVSNKQKGYYQGTWDGKETYITHAMGHLLEISEPAKQNPDWAEWKLETLPMIPHKLSLNLIEGKSYQFHIAKEILNKATVVINATDAGREGELIFRLVYLACKITVPVKRLWVQDPTDKSILAGFQNLKEGKDYDNTFFEAKARSEADWIVGMNASRAISITSKRNLSIGRVQTPTLALICERYLHNINFKPEPYFNLQIAFEHQQVKIQALYNKDFKDKTEAEAIKAQLKDTTICKEIETKTATENPPLPFSLAELQKQCNRKFHLSLTETMEIAQKLYEIHKLTTYPRTDSSHITENLYEELPELMKVLEQGTYGNLVKLLPKKYSKNCVNDAKVTDHYAIIPTSKSDIGVNLSEIERKVYALIVQRTIEALMPECIKDITLFTFENGGHDFFAKGVVIKTQGWREVGKHIQQKFEENENDTLERDEEIIIPIINQFQTFNPTSSEILTKKTKPKPIHTGASLVTAMENCSNEVDDDDNAKKALKKAKGIGRSSTRDSIVKALLDKELIEVKNKVKLFPTQKGLDLYQAVKEHSIASPKLTGQWEVKLSEIEEGTYSYQQFMEDIKQYTKDITSQLAEIGKTIQVEKKRLGVCPKCEAKNVISAVYEGKSSYYCDKFTNNKECDFGLPKILNGVPIPEDEMINLLKNRKTSLIKGFTFETKDKKTFKANRYLVLDENNKIKYEIPPDESIEVACPKCKKQTLAGQEKRIFCKQEGCNYVLYKDFWDVRIPDKSLKEMLQGKQVLVNGFKSKKDNKTKYSLILFLDEKGSVTKEFPKK